MNMTPFYIVKAFYGENDPRNQDYHFKNLTEVDNFLGHVKTISKSFVTLIGKNNSLTLTVTTPSNKVVSTHSF